MFSVFAPPARNSLLATWDDDVKLESIGCPLVPGHRRAGRRQSALQVQVPGIVGDIVWTWQRDCLLSDRVVNLINSEGLTGLTFRTAVSRSVSKQPLQQNYQELVVTGWGGTARPESGIKLQENCSGCGHLHYSNLVSPQMLVQQNSWDGSDFFIIWPLPRFIFVSDKVRRLFQKHDFGPCRFLQVSELKTGRSGFSPGRLSYWMPAERAAELGRSLGIE
jgi:hypothetical protein